MNRRGFFKALAATAVVAFASQTRLAHYSVDVVDDPVSVGRDYAEALARSLLETKETISANVLNRAFT